ncbi:MULTISPECIES: N-acetylmuramoyl-L-alanine amidase [Amniculibacterium]|uniref:N-acetylmuramoyl-L-alanine amidase family protein n=1 Tax=Amniculibacterium TaxID=2715289 RepID=UPI000F5A1208|nr:MULTISPECIES: N-acetylmuramoyl-L-alanine amidase [Amniculibacterium]
MNLIRFYFKRYFTFIFVFLFGLTMAQKKFTIVLDAGHGGEKDPGATRKYDDLGTVREKDITLAIVLKLGRMLEKNKEYKVIYTRKEDFYPSLGDRTDLANNSKADLFISVHVNSTASKIATATGTETFVQGPNQNKTNLEVAKRENDVVFLDDKDRERFASYDPSSPESLIALKVNQSKYLMASLTFGALVEENFVNKDKRYSRGVMQKDLHVLRMNAMPSVLIETGFINNPEDARYLASDNGQDEVAASIFDAIIKYKKTIDQKSGIKSGPKKEDKPAEIPLKNDFRIFLFSSANKYNENDPELKGLNNILILKENDMYKYYYGATNMASIRDNNQKTARDAGFRNSYSVGFVPNQSINFGYYTLEVAVSKEKLNSKSYVQQTLSPLERNKKDGIFYYTYGKVNNLEDAIKLQKEIEAKGIKNSVIEKKIK